MITSASVPDQQAIFSNAISSQQPLDVNEQVNSFASLNLMDLDSTIRPDHQMGRKHSQPIVRSDHQDLTELPLDPLSPRKYGHPVVQHRYKNWRDEDLLQEVNDKLTPEPILDLEDHLQESLGPVLGPLNTVEQDIEHDFDTIAEDIFPEAQEDLAGANWWEYVYYFRWIFNFLFVGCPWFFWSSMMVIANIVMNILMNQWWAGGNALLIFNTGYLMFQTVMSWPLVFEIPFFLMHMRYVRFFSVGIAWAYMLVYGFIIIDWIFQIYLEPTKAYEEYQFFDILVNMFLAYNIIFNLHIMPVNFAIVLKELTLEIFPPMLKQDKGTNLDMEDVEDVVSPNTYWDALTKGKLPDEEYHKNQYYQKPRSKKNKK